MLTRVFSFFAAVTFLVLTPFLQSAPLLEPDARGTSQELAIGELLPNVKLITGEKKEIEISDYRGKAVAITFIYSSCPSPQFCPLVRQNFDLAQSLLAKMNAGETCQLLSITLDPQHDTPEVLSAWAKASQANPQVWTFAAGSDADVLKLGQAVGLEVKRTGARIDHNLRTVVLNTAGEISHIFRGDSWTPQELAMALQSAARVRH